MTCANETIKERYSPLTYLAGKKEKKKRINEGQTFRSENDPRKNALCDAKTTSATITKERV